MYHIICILIIVFLTSCSTSNHSPKHKGHNHHHNHDKLNHHMVINHKHIDRGDHVQIIIKHKPRLSKYERKQIRKWCRVHYKHHNKPVKCKFVVVR
jgi:hypothetical protein